MNVRCLLLSGVVGDAFRAAFAVALVDGAPLADCLGRAAAAGWLGLGPLGQDLCGKLLTCLFARTPIKKHKAKIVSNVAYFSVLETAQGLAGAVPVSSGLREDLALVAASPSRNHPLKS